jgi:glutathione S-transferase
MNRNRLSTSPSIQIASIVAASDPLLVTLRLYEYPPSGNCLKVRILLHHLQLPYQRVPTDIFGGDTMTEEYAAKNPARQTPVLEVGGRYLPESNVILWFLAEGTRYLPDSPFERALVLRWLLFERDQVTAIASLRFRLSVGLLEPDDDQVEERLAACHRSLQHLDRHLSEQRFLVDHRYSIADIANYAYTHLAPEIGIPLELYPAVQRWVEEVERQPGFVNDLEPLPSEAHVGAKLSIYG